MPESFDSVPPLSTAAATTHSSVVAAISREIVRAHARYYGRGPTKARTVWREDVVVVVLEEIYTRAETTLIDAGHFDQVRATRQAFQDEIEPLFRQIIEEATGRRVRGFLSQVTPDGIGSEIFVLHHDRDDAST